jgi:hypothetical protein
VNLLFVELTQQAFSFLEGVGFRLTQCDPTRLQYESAQTFVAVEWDARSGELNVFIGLQPRQGEVRDAFSLRDLLAMENVDVPERKMPFQVAEEIKLGPFLGKMAEDTRAHARLALAGDRMFFRRLETFRSAQAEAYMQDMKLRRVRTEADQAWQKRDLDKLITLYTSIKDQLSASEKAKLDYAIGHKAH